jgi:hypothetical protein
MCSCRKITAFIGILVGAFVIVWSINRALTLNLKPWQASIIMIIGYSIIVFSVASCFNNILHDDYGKMKKKNKRPRNIKNVDYIHVDTANSNNNTITVSKPKKLDISTRGIKEALSIDINTDINDNDNDYMLVSPV